LVVDDDPQNRELLRDLLEAQGHIVSEAENSTTAFAAIAQAEPHVVLLDVMMPGINGFEVCRRLKADPVTASIPVLLVTALRERDDRLQGIAAGANDFITKPIDTREVVLRTRNAIHTKQLYDQVQAALKQLQQLERLRDNLTHMIVHDMRTPLTCIYSDLQMLEMGLGKTEADAQNRQTTAEALTLSRVMIEMVSSLLDVSRLEAGQMPLRRETCDLQKLTQATVKLLGGLLQKKALVFEVPAAVAPLSCDKGLIQRVIANLLTNANNYSPTDRPITISIQQTAETTRLAVSDQGQGIPPEFHTKIFEKFGQVEDGRHGKSYSSGLGLTFCKLAVEAHGGHIGVESIVGKGSTFWFTLPTAPATPAA
jgi:signal transduction histidine kinase